MVVDMSIAEDFALLESQREFVRRYRSRETDGVKNVLPMLASSCPGKFQCCCLVFCFDFDRQFDCFAIVISVLF